MPHADTDHDLSHHFPDLIAREARTAPPFIVRRARPADADALAALFRDGYARLLARDYHANVLKAALPVITTPRPDLLVSGTYYVADTGAGVLLAAGGWSWRGPLGGASPLDTGHMRHVVVASEYAGRGIGRVLVEHAMAQACKAGAGRLLCLSTLTARGFYRALGFAEQGDVALTLAPGLSFPAVAMEARL